MTSPADYVDTITRAQGAPSVALPHWRRILDHAFTLNADGRLPYHTIVLGAPKKEGRTTVLAGIGLWALDALLGQGEEVLVFGCPRDSALPRAWNSMLHATPEEDRQPRVITAERGGAARPMSHDCGGEGPTPRLTLWDDLWIEGKDTRDAWDSMAESVRVVSSYAGYAEPETDATTRQTMQSRTLVEIYLRGARLPPVPELDDLRGWQDEPVVRAGDGMFFFWDTVHRAPWITKEYLTAQREALRPSEYLRLHHNQWVGGETAKE